MGNSNKHLGRLRWAVHIIIIIAGIAAIFWAKSLTPSFEQDLLLSMGSNLIVVTILFTIFRLFDISQNDETQLSYENDKTTSQQFAKNTTGVAEVPDELKGALKGRAASPSLGSVSRPYEVGSDDNEKR